MIEIYKKELENKLKNVEFNTIKAHFHNIDREELNLLYKNFYHTNNSSSFLYLEDLEVDNLSFALYEDWLVRRNDN